jgi:hypothetical protein
MLRRVVLVRTHDSEELSASFIRVTRIGELGTTLAVTSNRRTLRLVTMMKEAQVPPKRRYLQEAHGVTSQKAPFFIVTAVKTSNLTTTLFDRVLPPTFTLQPIQRGIFILLTYRSS